MAEIHRTCTTVQLNSANVFTHHKQRIGLYDIHNTFPHCYYYIFEYHDNTMIVALYRSAWGFLFEFIYVSEPECFVGLKSVDSVCSVTFGSNARLHDS